MRLQPMPRPAAATAAAKQEIAFFLCAIKEKFLYKRKVLYHLYQIDKKKILHFSGEISAQKIFS